MTKINSLWYCVFDFFLNIPNVDISLQLHLILFLYINPLKKLETNKPNLRQFLYDYVSFAIDIPVQPRFTNWSWKIHVSNAGVTSFSLNFHDLMTLLNLHPVFMVRSVSPLPYNLGPMISIDCNREEIKADLNHYNTCMTIQICWNLGPMVWCRKTVWSKI